ncbi:MAG TPA: hypothetical protein VLC46_24510 [Thermoanaerobaculia bacterium]|jgi:hypothetical protein|nr:hypothetical protein [Thermoanaerobaculia bacterium]
MPSGTLAAQIANKLGRGSIYHGYVHFVGHGKWIAVLNDKWPPDDGVAVYAFFTTKADRFKRAKIPPSVYLEIEIGDYTFCTEPTILDLTDILKRPMREILDARMFEYCGQLKQEHLARADAIVETSTYVSKVNRRSILGSRYPS